MAALYGFESRHRHHSEMTFVCQMPAQARSSRQQRSFFVQTRDRFAGSRICFWAGRILFAGRTRTGRRPAKMGFYVIVPRKARHDSTGNPISSFKPAIAPLDCEFVLGGGRFLLTGRTWTGSVGWQTSEPMCSFLVCLTKPLATIYNFKCIS